MSELLVSKRAVSVRRDPLQRVRDESVPMGEAEGWSQEARSRRSLDTPALRSTCTLAYNEFLHPKDKDQFRISSLLCYTSVA